jgi:predicted DCC family thiol-disulfide oxidoreductase YuxK
MNKEFTLFYDANCRLCTATVAFLRSKIDKDVLDFIPLQSDITETMFKSNYPVPACDSVILVRIRTKGNWDYYTKSDAVIYCAGLLTFPWNMIKFLVIIPKSLRDKLYDVIARYRYSIFGRTMRCDFCKH